MRSCLSIQPIRRIAVLRALQLGDLLCAVPAWRALKTAYPQASITLIGLPWAEEFVRRFHRYLDGFISFPGYPGLPEQQPNLDRLATFLADMRRHEFDLFLQMQGCGTYVNDLASLCGARDYGGYYPSQTCQPQGGFMPYPEGLPEVHRHLRLMEFLGVPAQGDHLEFPLTEQDHADFAVLTRETAFSPESSVCIHPGGRGMNRRWEPERFAKVAESWSRRGRTIVLTGTAAEQSLGEYIARRLSRPPVNLMGKTTLGTLGVLLSRTSLLVANDTGISHMAAAFGTPSVIICVGSDPVRWGPLNRERHRLLVGSETTVDEVLEEGVILLNGSGSARDESVRNEPTLKPVAMPSPVAASVPLRVSVAARPLRVLTWHVHGNYLYYLTHTPHQWFLPVGPSCDGYAGCAPGFPWSERVHDVPVEQLRRTPFDCILFQSRAAYGEDQYKWLSDGQRRLPRIYLEHDPPWGDPTECRHPVDDPEMLLVHVTRFNELMWDNGRTPTCVIEHGIPPPHTGLRYTGELARGLVVVNDLPRRGRRVGADIWEAVRRTIPLDLIGMNSLPAGGLGEISHEELPAFMCKYRFFFNPIRYTSLGLAVCEAMHLGLPIVALATTEMATVITNDVSGYVETNVETLMQRMAFLLASPGKARLLGEGARRTAETRFGLDRFTDEWDRTIRNFVARRSSSRAPVARVPGAALRGQTLCTAK